jgi:hypothetical protein
VTVAALLSAAPKWRRLSNDERRTFIHAALLVPALHVAVRLAGYNRLHGWVIATPAGTTRPAPPSAHALRTCVVSINRVKRFSPVGGNCLSQSLALARLLRRHGFEPALRLGVRLNDAKFEAHAWIELDGRVLNDTQDVHTRFRPLTAATGS